ncbi:hypothetical protein MCOR27_011307 [Pyricularia oryzae]|uniref:Uncharacterized protein n=4 Tax=Pyricularia TaxID=48558 RepID=A0ABQ8N4P1_PYRGI|nr:uncharacterized protein MGG_04851 [Pyricularia oryzae 70-15]ELQ34739.1 hypothetical protein OOU_Y34scaffold00745g13 [Pyricularia oryzae Y34]KAH8847717.1 hypothetical protein MCOR01_001122 [Pyricularia oryzae]KAI6291139.1 hypothetical protein MCOR33_010812 [Pyricularia grisea]EHA52522.1 hypothetical protein MGG_04851 [Pyricularia oryzae 70-15]KAH9430353.1 hypothetical protein MCOR02_010062 [Pyricularia oryzae]
MGCCNHLFGHHGRRHYEGPGQAEEDYYHQKKHRPLSASELVYADRILNETRHPTPHPNHADYQQQIPASGRTSCCEPLDEDLFKTRRQLRREKRSDEGSTFQAELNQTRYSFNRAEDQEARFSHAQQEHKKAAAAAERLKSLTERETGRETVEMAYVAARLRDLADQAELDAQRAQTEADEAVRRYSLAHEAVMNQVEAGPEEQPEVAERLRSLAEQADLQADKARHAAKNASRRHTLIENATHQETQQAVAIASRLNSLALAAEEKAKIANEAAEMARRKSSAALKAVKVLRDADKKLPAPPDVPPRQSPQLHHQRSLFQALGDVLGLTQDPLAVKPTSPAPAPHRVSADEMPPETAASEQTANKLPTVQEVPTPVSEPNDAASAPKPKST